MEITTLALTRAQLLSGDGGQGFVLPGQVQAVKEGNGITILVDGTIEVDSQTVQGVMRLGQTKAYADSAYNKYWWPLAVNGADVGKQLTVTGIDGSGNATLEWADSDGIDWTARGQIIAAIGAGEQNDTLVNIGSARSFLMSQVDNVGNPSGLAYSDVITSAMKVPSGQQTQRPTVGLVPGEFRFNTTQAKLEVWDGAEWQTVASEDPADGSFVKQIKPTVVGETDVAAIPAGTTAEQITVPAPQEGYLRFNQDLNTLEFWDGGAWSAVAAAPAPGGFVPQTAPDGAAVLPKGPDGTRPTGAALATGEFRYNTGSGELEFYNGSQWSSLGPTQGGVRSFVQNSAPTAVNVGDLWYDTIKQAEFVWNGVGWVAPGVTQTGPNASATIPAGTTLQRGTPSEGSFRLNVDNGKPEMYIGGQWRSIPASATGSFVSESVATTGTNSAVIPAGPSGSQQSVPAPAAGYLRYNSTEGQMEYYDGFSWILIGSSATGSFVDKTVPTAPPTATPNAVIPAGSTGDRQTAPAVVDGEFRLNTTTGKPEMYISGSWQSIPASTTGSFVAQTVPTTPGTATPNAVIPSGSTADRQTAPAVVDGEFRFNSDLDQLEVYTSSGWQTVPSSASGNFVQQSIPTAPAGATPVAIIPSGTTLERQTAPAVTGGETRFNTDTFLMEVYNGTTWTAVGAPPNAGLGLNLSGSSPNEVLKVSISQQSAPPAAGPLPAEAIDGSLYWDDVLGAMFIRYNNSGSPTWVQIIPDGGGGLNALTTAVDFTAAANDYVVVTAATKTITLPAAPANGDVVTVVVAGTWLDTIVARNGSNIMGLAQNITLDKQYAAMQFTYVSSTSDWRLN